MPDVFRTPATAQRAGANTLVAHCSSSAYQPYFEEFLDRKLGLEHYAVLALPGGVQTLTLFEYLPKYSWSGWRMMKFLVDVDKPARVILIGHQDCRWYADLRFWDRGRSERERIVADLRQAGEECARRFPACRVELYFARQEGADVVFESC
jgi:hypothetical protein